MKKILKKQFALCPYCIEAIKSRGEKLLVGDYCEEEKTCSWCDEVFEESDNELKYCTWC